MRKKRGALPLALFGLAIFGLAVSFFVGLSSWGKPSHRIAMATVDVKAIQSLAARHRLTHGGRCTTPRELRAEVRNLALVDPWGSAYVIRCNGADTKTLSFGPDTKEGTADDIVWQE